MAGRRATEGAGGFESVHYGRRNAETDERYHAHLLERQLEALANEDEPPRIRVAPSEQGTPIGGLPPVDREPEDGVWRSALLEAGRRLDALTAAARELAMRAGKLASLPFEVLRKARPDGPPETEVDLSIASYNMHSGVGTDGRFDLRRTGEVLREIGADLVALQECGDFRARAADGRDHPEQLAKLLGYHMAFAPNVVREGRRYGNAVLSRLPLQHTHNYDLTVKGRQPRGALLCDVELAAKEDVPRPPLHLFCLHLGLTARERRAQESMLLSADILRDAARRDPVIVCGDFNYWWSGPVPALVRSSIRDAALELGQPDRTYPSRLPLLRLDRFFIAGGVRPVAVRVHRSALSAVASDHLPVVMRFETLPAHRPSDENPVTLSS